METLSGGKENEVPQSSSPIEIFKKKVELFTHIRKELKQDEIDELSSDLHKLGIDWKDIHHNKIDLIEKAVDNWHLANASAKENLENQIIELLK